MSFAPSPTIPTEPDLPKGADRDPVLRVPNFADKHDTVKKFYQKSHDLYLFHKSQPLRYVLERRMDDIDQYCRVTVSHAKEDADKTPDIVQWRPPQLMSAIEVVTSNQVEILLPRNEPIGKFVPLANLDDAARPITAELVRRRNLMFEYSNEIDNRIPKYRKAIWTTNKYGDCVLEMGWKDKTYGMDIPKRAGVMGSFQNLANKLKKHKTTVRETHSELRIHDFKDFYCDMLLDDDTDVTSSLCHQQGFEIRCRTPYSVLTQKQRDKEYKNVEFVNDHQLYEGESPDYRLQQRQANAGESSDASRRTGEHEVWERWMLAPINENGDWDEQGTQARWFWGTFCGRCDNQGLNDEPPKSGESGVICLRLSPNPYPYDELPFTVVHSQLDDKGLMHRSYYDDSKSVLEQLQKVNNNYMYAKDIQAAAPWLVEQGVIIGSKTFDGGPTSLIEVRMGGIDRIRRLDVNVNTADNIQMIQYQERVFWEDIMLMPKGFRGKEMGSRTSATEAGTANAQAAKPFLARVRYLGYQIIAWAARKDAIYTAKFAPESLKNALAGNPSLDELAPEDLYGPLRYKITCVDDYENSIMEKAEQDRFAQIWGPMIAPVIGKRGMIEAGKWAFSKHGAPIEKIFPMPNEGDAVSNSNRENDLMLSGQWTMPGDNEDDDTHIATHTNFMQVLKTQPPGDYNPQAMGYLQAHILMHKQKQQQQNQQQQQTQGQPATGLGTGETPANTPGEAGQDMLGAIGGGM